MSRRHPNICDTDLCTTDIDDKLLCNSGLIDSAIPVTDNLSTELSELMMSKNRRRSRSNNSRILNIMNKSNKNIHHHHDDNVTDEISKLKKDICCLYDTIKKLNKDVYTLEHGKNPQIECLEELTCKVNTKANKNDIVILDGKVHQLECVVNDKIHHLQQNKNCGVLGNPEYEAKIYRYIDCKVNEKVDGLMDFINKKLNDCDTNIENLRKMIVNIIKNYPVRC